MKTNSFLYLHLVLAGLISFASSFSRQSTVHQRRKTILFSHDDDHDPSIVETSLQRRRFFKNALLGAASLLSIPTEEASAKRGLVQFPCDYTLSNTYHFMRIGESLLEEQNIWSTNPLFLTNREAALSPLGISQVNDACEQLKKQPVTVIKHSFAAASIDTANLVGEKLQLGRNLIVPEFFFMDPRAIGRWDMLSLDTTLPAVWAMDAAESGAEGTGGRPPAHEDSTPHETLADQSVRLRQLLSAVETQYSGETILMVFPDGTGPALLSAMMAGIPYDRVHELEYQPGEVRLNITLDSTRNLLAAREKDDKFMSDYKSVLDQGKVELQRLRETESIVSAKDELIERERLAMEAEYERRTQQRLEIENQQKLERAQKQMAMQSTDSTAEGTSSSLTINPAILGSAGVVAVGLGAAVFASNGSDKIGKSDSIDNINAEESAAKTKYVQATNTTSSEPPNPRGGLYGDLPELALAATIAESSSPTALNDAVESPKRKLVNGDARTGTFPDKNNPKRNSDNIVQDYMDQDDGAEAWLMMMSEIANEDDSESTGNAANDAYQ